jgi:UDP-glucose 4-epimerase
MTHILVTGGTGFIGSHTVVSLIEAGYIPVIIDNLSNSNKKSLKGISAITNKEVIFYEGDVRDATLVLKIMIEHDIHDIIHFAAYKAVGESMTKPLEYYENNVYGLISLLNTVSSIQPLRFVFSSSATVYGIPDSLPITENSPLQKPTNPYGATKQMAEQIISDVQKSNPHFTACLLRYFNPIGAHPSSQIGELPSGIPNNLVPFITQAAAGIRDKLTIYGDDYDTPDGTAIRDYIHVVDLANAHVKALKYVEKNTSRTFPAVFNLGTGKGTSVKEIITAFERSTGKKVPFSIGTRRPGDAPLVYADVTKAETELDWKATKTLDEALLDAWHWQESL